MPPAAAAAINRSGTPTGSVGTAIAIQSTAPTISTLLGMIRRSRSVSVTTASTVTNTRPIRASAASWR